MSNKRNTRLQKSRFDNDSESSEQIVECINITDDMLAFEVSYTNITF